MGSIRPTGYKSGEVKGGGFGGLDGLGSDGGLGFTRS